MRCSQLNVAQPGGTHRSMAGQATDIITKMKDANWTDGDVDYDNDWKMLTLFIGGNDLCRVCEDWVSVLLFYPLTLAGQSTLLIHIPCTPCDDAAVVATQETYMPDAYVAGITEALDRLHADMPRAIVNLVVMFDISPLTNISDRLLCDAVQL